MKTKMYCILAGLLLLASGTLMAQEAPGPIPKPVAEPELPPDSTVSSTMSCPGVCTGDCEFEITVRSNEGDSCEANQVYIELDPQSPNGDCRADFNRSGGGDISYILCDGEKCVLDEDVFTDTTFWPPYWNPGNPAPPGKRAISQACFEALRLWTSPQPNGDVEVRYEFTGVKTVMPDFGIETICFCTKDTTYVIDTLEIEIDSATVYVVKEEVKEEVTSNKIGANLYETGSFAIKTLYPNPASDQVNILIESPFDDVIRMALYDGVGKKSWQSAQVVHKGENLINIEVSHLKGGIYYLTLLGAGDQIVTLKFVHK